MNTKANKVCKTAKKTFGKYVYSIWLHIPTLICYQKQSIPLTTSNSMNSNQYKLYMLPYKIQIIGYLMDKEIKLWINQTDLPQDSNIKG